MIIRSRSHPRAALIGNPSDGYNGKTIAFLFSDFGAEVTLYETPEVEILPNTRDHSTFGSIQELVQDVRQHGYYGGIRLLKAAVRLFSRYCRHNGITLHDRNFTIRYESTIPHSLGLAGSSAITTAGMQALMAFYGVTIQPAVLANMVMAVETEELHIPAGLQDRVAQAYAQPVFMDFNADYMEKHGFGRYEPFAADLLPNLYIAYRTDLSESSEVLHGDLRTRYNKGDANVHQAMVEWAALTDQVHELIKGGKGSEIGPLLDRNFDLRQEVCDVNPRNAEMVALAREIGVSAKFTGSGGAIIGTYGDDAQFNALQSHLTANGIQVFKPQVVTEPMARPN